MVNSSTHKVVVERGGSFTEVNTEVDTEVDTTVNTAAIVIVTAPAALPPFPPFLFSIFCLT